MSSLLVIISSELNTEAKKRGLSSPLSVRNNTFRTSYQVSFQMTYQYYRPRLLKE